ncbi:peptidoglycan/LPS O-acetylase OafA/YrhL [Kitasatospora gansuensis]|uniref:Peptidoglycan/LPS O-acetylase OafA/YrhL n=1 Tax=Kitasatospora gansuensis TaxID=258050 RepID=A0A7W7WFM8_9ACTN|nr:acyltransferase family protein [Kitasatospora gansuensis]MBB4944715.1 peptidoglycan/LPS O-acetylase OafA/YrhL [Kitasatospora gansuensis]
MTDLITLSRATAAPPPPRLRTAPAAGFRADLEGLRGVAVLAVLGFHAGVPALTGGYVGVDVFFVLSGFLITGLLTGQRPLGFREFCARRARRILPAAAVVLTATAVAGRLLLDPLRGTDLARDLLAAAGQFANWRFAGQHTDYLAATRDPSPVLHFWSLGVENQFYLLWGAVLLLAARWRRLAVLLLTLGVGAASFLLCLRWTADAAPLGYFSTATRLWEFALGAAAALLYGRRLVGAAVLGWLGLAAVIAGVLLYDRSTPFPGSAALLPTLGTVALLLAGPGGRWYQAGSLLAVPPLRAAGRISYSWYLWHWPLLAVAEARYGTLSLPVAVALVLGAALPAWLTLRLVELPLRRGTAGAPRKGLAVGAVALTVPLIAGLTLGGGAVRALGDPGDAAAVPAGAASGPGLLVVGGQLPGLTPSLARARTDFPPGEGCEIPLAAEQSPTCRFGTPNARQKIVLLGDSHAGQWISALLPLVRERDWALEVLVKPGCPLPTLTVQNTVLGREYTECDRWREHTLARLAGGPAPELVVLAGLNRYGDPAERAAGWATTLERLRALGAPLAYLADTPMPGKDIPVCLAAEEDCTFPRSAAFAPEPLLTDGLAARYGVQVLDYRPLLCPPPGDCPPVREGVLLYRDTGHITNTLAATLAPRIRQDLVAAGLLH